MPTVFDRNIYGQPVNALAEHLRAATHSRRIPHTHRVVLATPETKRLPVPRSNAGIFGLGDATIVDTSRNVGTPIPAEQVERLALPLANAIPRTHRRTLSIPVSHRLPAPQYQQLPKPHRGAAFPGVGEWFLGDLAGQTTLVRGQKPRTMGGTLPVYHDFIPGLGEEADGDIYAEGYLTASDLAADAVPSNVAAQDAAVAAAAATKQMLMLTIGVAALGYFLLKR